MMRDRVESNSGIERDVFPDVLNASEGTRQPVVASIKRAAPAGAFELTLSCDFRVIGRDANYGLLEVKLGTFPHGGGTQRLPRLVGLSEAKEIVLTGDWVDPEEAKEFGLVYEACEPDAVDERAKAFADQLCENAPIGLSTESAHLMPPSRPRWRRTSGTSEASPTRWTTPGTIVGGLRHALRIARRRSEASDPRTEP